MRSKTIVFTKPQTAELLCRETKPVTGVSAAMQQAPEVYTQLCHDPEFPMGTVFDWRE